MIQLCAIGSNIAQTLPGDSLLLCHLQLQGCAGMAAAGREQREEWGPIPGVPCSGAGVPEHSSMAQHGLCQPIPPLPPACSLHSGASENSQKFLPAEALRREHEPLTLPRELLASYSFRGTFISGTVTTVIPFPYSGGSLAPELSCRQGPDRAFSCHMHC